MKELYGNKAISTSISQTSGTSYEYVIRSMHDDGYGFIFSGEDSKSVVVKANK